MISEEDRDNIRAHNLRMISNMSRRAFNQMRYAFRHKIDIGSFYIINRRLAILSGVDPVLYDCCINSCMAYTRDYLNDNDCPFCHEPRRRDGKPRRQFSYLPFATRLQGFFQNPKTVEKLAYRSQFVASADRVNDVFDSELYQQLLRKHVEIDGQAQPHKYFSGKHDIAFSLCLDGYLLFGKRMRRSGPSATPIVLQNYNLPPTIRIHMNNLICVGVIPGPKQPLDWGSFLVPVDDELAVLAHGLATYDSVEKEMFILRAYLLFKLGDMQAINKVLGIRGHNSFAPCRSCHIKGCRNIIDHDTIYYVPLNAPRMPGAPARAWDPEHLPMRTHNDFLVSLQAMDDAPSKTACEAIGFNQGLRERPLLRRVGSIDYARSIPWDWMHLLLENVCPLMVDHWMGKFKKLDVGSGNYVIPPLIWEDIGLETAAAVRSIPAPFVRVLVDIARERSFFTAESWCFWFIYLAPTLLKGRFQEEKYHRHLCQLVEIMEMSLQFEITYNEIDDLRAKIINWVQDYEKSAFNPQMLQLTSSDIYCRYYYQYSETRLSACPAVIHGLLHIPDNIRDCGPEWSTWTFHMERYCGMLQGCLHSRSQPWGNLNKHILRMAYLAQLHSKFNLEEELTVVDKHMTTNALSRYERDFPDCEFYSGVQSSC